MSFPDPKERSHYGDVMFASGKAPFAAMSTKEGFLQFQVQLEPDHVRAVLAQDPRFTKYPRAKDVVSLDARKIADWDEVRALVEESFDLVMRKRAPPKPRARK